MNHIEHFGLAVPGKRLFDRLDTELGFQRDREPPGKEFSAEPIHDGRKVDEARCHRDMAMSVAQTWFGRVTGSSRNR